MLPEFLTEAADENGGNFPPTTSRAEETAGLQTSCRASRYGRKTINTSVLAVAYLEYGPASGWPCIMGHGFPYDAHAYDQAAPILAQAGARVIVPYLRGYGPTRFLNAETPRSGEQAALGADLLDFMDALKIERAVLGGYDWGGRAACIVAALWPERVVALVSGNSYNIQNIAHAMEPASAARGGGALVSVLLPQRAWPAWPDEEPEGDRAPPVAHVVAELGVRRCDLRSDRGVVRQSRLCRRRHPFLSPSLRARALAIRAMMRSKCGSRRSRRSRFPPITIDGDADGVNRGTAHHAKKFTGPHEHRIFMGAGHNLPQERPEEWARAVIDARKMANA